MKESAQVAFGAMAAVGGVVGGLTGFAGIVIGDTQSDLAAVAVYGMWSLYGLMPIAIFAVLSQERTTSPAGTALGGTAGAVLGSLLFVVVATMVGNVLGGLESATTSTVVLEQLGWGRLMGAALAGAGASAAAGFVFR